MTTTNSKYNLLLIDYRIQEYQTIINARNDRTFCLVFNYFHDTYTTIKQKMELLSVQYPVLPERFMYHNDPVTPIQPCFGCDDSSGVLQPTDISGAIINNMTLEEVMSYYQTHAQCIIPYFADSATGTINVHDLPEIIEAYKASSLYKGPIFFDSVGVVQHNFHSPSFSFLEKETSCTLMDVSGNDPELQTWGEFANFIAHLKTNYEAQHFDMMACALYADENWKYVIDTLQFKLNIDIRASLDVTGQGGNWVMETDNVNLTDVYFSSEEAINQWKYSLYYADNRFYALRFNNSMWASTGHYAAMNIGGGSFTFECWYYETSVANNATIWDKGNYNYTWQIRAVNTGFSIYNANMGWLNFSNSSIPQGTWVHLALVRNASTNLYTSYINGVAQHSISNSTALYMNNSNFNLGRQSPDTCSCNLLKDNTYFYDLRMWNVARTVDQIKYNMNRVVPSNSSGLVLNYLMNDQASIIRDRTSNQLHVTIQNYLSGNWTNTVMFIPNIGYYIHQSSSLKLYNGLTMLQLSNYNIGCTDLSGCDVRNADMSGAIVSNTSFYGANLTNSNLANSVMNSNTSFAGATLTNFRATNITGSPTLPGGYSLQTYDVSFNANALHFDGVNDTVYVRTYPTLDTLSQTQEAWVYPYSRSAGISIMTLNNNGGLGIDITTGKASNWFYTSNGQWTSCIANTAVPLNTWTHVAFVRNDNGSDKIYYNGVLDISQADPYPAVTLGACGGMSIASNYQANSGYSNCMLSEIRVWNSARTSTEILANYNRQLYTFNSSLVAYYRFNQGTPSGTNSGVTRLIDYSGYACHGTLTNMALTGSTSNWVSGPPALNTRTVGNIVGPNMSYAWSDLSGVNFSSMDLSGSNITYARLANANLTNTKLYDYQGYALTLPSSFNQTFSFFQCMDYPYPGDYNSTALYFSSAMFVNKRLGMAFDALSNYVSSSSYSNGVIRNLITGVDTTYAMYRPNFGVFDPSRNAYYVGSWNTSGLYKVDLSTNAVTVLYGSDIYISNATMDSTFNNLYFAGDTNIYKRVMSTGTVSTIYSGGRGGGRNIYVEPTNTYLIYGSYSYNPSVNSAGTSGYFTIVTLSNNSAREVASPYQSLNYNGTVNVVTVDPSATFVWLTLSVNQANNLYFYFPFDNNTMIDVVSNTYAKVMGDVSFGPGRVGINSAYFNNTVTTQVAPTQYLTMSNSNYMGSMSISFWMKFTNNSSSQTVMGLSSTGNVPCLQLDLYNGVFYVYGGFPSLWSVAINNGTALSVNTWHHIAVTFNASNYQVILYVNGSQAASGTGSGLPSNTSSYQRWLFGGSSDMARGFNGYLDEIRIYKKVLTAANVSSLNSLQSIDVVNNVFKYQLSTGTQVAQYTIPNGFYVSLLQYFKNTIYAFPQTSLPLVNDSYLTLNPSNTTVTQYTFPSGFGNVLNMYYNSEEDVLYLKLWWNTIPHVVQFSSQGAGLIRTKNVVYGRQLNYSNVEISGVDLSAYDMSGSDFTNAVITNVTINSATNLRNATLTGVTSRNIVGTTSNLPTGWVITNGAFVNQITTTLTNYGDISLNTLDSPYTITAPTSPSNGAFTYTSSNTSVATVSGAIFTLVGAGTTTVTISQAISLPYLDASATIVMTVVAVNYDGQQKTGLTLTNKNFEAASCIGTNFSNTNLSGSNFTNAVLRGANLTNATMTGATLTGVDMSGANFTGATLTNATMTNASLSGATMTGIVTGNITNLVTAILPSGYYAKNGYIVGPYVSLASAVLTNQNLSNISLQGVNLNGASLSGATMTNTDLSGATFTNINVAGLNMASVTLTNIVTGGLTGGSTVTLPTNMFVAGGYIVGPNMRLISADLSGQSMISRNLTNANLTNANLTNVDFSGATLTGVSFTGATLSNCNMLNANIAGITFSALQCAQLLKNPLNKNIASISSGITNLQPTDIASIVPSIPQAELKTITTVTAVVATNGAATVTASPTNAFYIVAEVNAPLAITSNGTTKTFTSDGNNVLDGSGNVLTKPVKFGGTVYKLYAGSIVGIPLDINLYKVVNVGLYDVLSNSVYVDGPTGATGPKGSTGYFGVTGPTGVYGLAGIDGTTGPTGPTGSYGSIGNTGVYGLVGETGIDGKTGPTGPQGPQGDPGTQSGQGPTGPWGEVGVTGPTGEQGRAATLAGMGSTGSVGDTGPNGISGGLIGMGPTGSTGCTGTTMYDSWQLSSGTSNLYYFKEAGGVVGLGTASPDPRYALDVSGAIKTVGIGNISDYRVKYNVVDLPDDKTVDALHPVSYMNRITGRQEHGFIAHELAQTYPEMVTGEKDDAAGYQAVHYNQLFAVLVSEIKHLRNDVAGLEETNAALQDEFDNIVSMRRNPL